jgi:hypothetical protein
VTEEQEEEMDRVEMWVAGMQVEYHFIFLH